MFCQQSTRSQSPLQINIAMAIRGHPIMVKTAIADSLSCITSCPIASVWPCIVRIGNIAVHCLTYPRELVT